MSNKVISKVERIRWIKNSAQIEVTGYAYIDGVNINTEEKIKKSVIMKNKDKEFVIPVKSIFRDDIIDENMDINYDYCGFKFIIESSFIDDMKPLGDGKWSIKMYINADGKEAIESLIVSDLYSNLNTRIINDTPKGRIYKISSCVDDNQRLYIQSNSEKIKFMKLKVFKFKTKQKIKKSKIYKNLSQRSITMLYNIFSMLPIKDEGVAFLTDSGAMIGNFKVVYNELDKQDKYKLKYICKKHDDKKTISEKVKTIYYLARYKTIFLDDFYPFLNKISPRKGIRIVQLWHAPGAFKKFGFSRKGKPGWKKNVEKRKHHRAYTHAIVSSNNISHYYAEAFRISKDKVISTGIPRTDILFNDEYKKEKIKDLYHRYPLLKNKKVILLAPTYRGEVMQGYYKFDELDISKMKNLLGEEYVVAMKLHQFISNSPKWEDKYSDFIIDLSNEKEITDLFFIADILITDYSSVVFEYSLLNKPMLFFAYDLEQYIADRDFYYPYESFVPGPIVKNTDELINVIRSNSFDMEKVKEFREKFFDHFDGKSTQRVIDMLFNEK